MSEKVLAYYDEDICLGTILENIEDDDIEIDEKFYELLNSKFIKNLSFKVKEITHQFVCNDICLIKSSGNKDLINKKCKLLCYIGEDENHFSKKLWKVLVLDTRESIYIDEVQLEYLYNENDNKNKSKSQIEDIDDKNRVGMIEIHGKFYNMKNIRDKLYDLFKKIDFKILEIRNSFTGILSIIGRSPIFIDIGEEGVIPLYKINIQVIPTPFPLESEYKFIITDVDDKIIFEDFF